MQVPSIDTKALCEGPKSAFSRTKFPAFILPKPVLRPKSMGRPPNPSVCTRTGISKSHGRTRHKRTAPCLTQTSEV
jgi:hypothetical protein